MTSIHTPGGHALGYKRDRPDARDWRLPQAVAPLPPAVDLCPQLGAVRDQGQLGACTGFAVTTHARQVYTREGFHHPYDGAPLFVYFNERTLEGTVPEDAGATIRDSIRAVAQWGIPAEHWCPYDISMFTTPPAPAAYANAQKHEALAYYRMSTVDELRACLAAGYSLVLGIDVYESFESRQAATTGIIPLPQPGEQLLGGHALCCCGYNDATRRFLFQNSWGTSFGASGYIFIGYDYIGNAQLCGDIWSIRLQK